MKLTTKTRYSLRILIQLALSPNKPVKGKDIAEEQKITEPYLEQIMISLKTAEFVITARGCNGGYILNRKPDEITVLDVIELFEGKIRFAECFDNEPCSMFHKCPTTKVWKMLSSSLAEKAKQISLSTIIESMPVHNELEYVI